MEKMKRVKLEKLKKVMEQKGRKDWLNRQMGSKLWGQRKKDLNLIPARKTLDLTLRERLKSTDWEDLGF